MSDARTAPRMKCCVCRIPYGAHIQCCYNRKCCTSFHAMCARLAGLPLQTVDTNAPLTSALKARLRQHNGFTEGVSCGNGLRLLSYCSKHAGACANVDDVISRSAAVAMTPSGDLFGMLPECPLDVCCKLPTQAAANAHPGVQ